jgi:MscS family membrane protein
MENQLQLWQTIQESVFESSITIANIPISKIILITVILVMTQALKQVIFPVIFNKIEQFTSKTNTTFDDELIQILKPPLGWLIFLGGLWLAQLILATELGEQLSQTIFKLLNVLGVSTVAYVVYRVSPLLGAMLGNFAARTETELDNLLVPYLPKLFQTAAIVIVVLKGSELLY